MIESFRHKGLEKLFTTGSKSKIDVKMAKRLQFILGHLNDTVAPGDMGLHGLRIHPMREGNTWGTVDVAGNWMVLFPFEGENTIDVNLIDYH